MRSQHELKRQCIELGELGKLCSALWDEQRDDKALIKKLSGENAGITARIFVKNHMGDRIPRKLWPHKHDANLRLPMPLYGDQAREK